MFHFNIYIQKNLQEILENLCYFSLINFFPYFHDFGNLHNNKGKRIAPARFAARERVAKQLFPLRELRIPCFCSIGNCFTISYKTKKTELTFPSFHSPYISVPFFGKSCLAVLLQIPATPFLLLPVRGYLFVIPAKYGH